MYILSGALNIVQVNLSKPMFILFSSNLSTLNYTNMLFTLNNLQVDLNKPMSEVLNLLSSFPIRTRLSLTGTLIVARDIAHAKLQERLDKGEGLPEYMKNHPVYYAGPAKTPDVGFVC